MAKTPILTKDGLIKYDNNIKDYINAAIDRVEISGAVTLMGTLGTDGDITELPPTYKKGEMYQVVTEGEYAGKKCEVGDFIVAVRDNRVTIVGLPEVIYDDFNNHILYQIYNPITDEYDNTIYYVATWESPYNVYGYSYRETEPEYKILAFTSCVKYKTENNGITWDVVSVNTLEGLTERESETVNYKVLYTTYPIYNADGTGVIAIPANPYTDNSMDAFNADWAVIQGNIEDLVSEGAIYIDPEEETPDIGDIEDVTSAKFVSYNNTDSGLEATNVQDAVDELKESKASKSDIDEVNTYLRKGGSKNLVELTISSRRSVGGCGVSLTVNDDKSISLSGTQLGTTFGNWGIGKAYLKANTEYILSGCPEGGSKDTFHLYIPSCNVYDIGEGVTFTVDEDKEYSVCIPFIKDVTYDGITYYPMIREATEDDTYEPYYEDAMTIVNNALVHGDVVDNLSSSRTDLPLSANQGRNLEKIIRNHLMYHWEHTLTGSTDIYLRASYGRGFKSFQGIVQCLIPGGDVTVAIVGAAPVDSYFQGMYVTTLKQGNKSTITKKRANQKVYIHINVNIGADGYAYLSVMIPEEFQYYIGSEPSTTESDWITIE